jgi:hypothetical protein
MRIRITRTPSGATDGVDLRTLEVGSCYDVSPALGAHLVATRCGELLATQEPMLLVGLPDQRIGYGIASARAVATDRGRRSESILSYEPADPARHR